MGIKPFLLNKSYIRNYLNTGKNRCNKIYYFEVKTDEKINLNRTNYTEEEKSGNFELRYIPLRDVKIILIDNNKYSDFKNITYEMLIALDVYFEQ